MLGITTVGSCLTVTDRRPTRWGTREAPAPGPHPCTAPVKVGVLRAAMECSRWGGQQVASGTFLCEHLC